MAVLFLVYSYGPTFAGIADVIPVPDSAIALCVSDDRHRQNILANSRIVHAAGGAVAALQSTHAQVRAAAHTYVNSCRERTALLKKQGVYKRPTKEARRQKQQRKVLRAQTEVNRRLAADLQAAKAVAVEQTAAELAAAEKLPSPLAFDPNRKKVTPTVFGEGGSHVGAEAVLRVPPELPNILSRVSYPGTEEKGASD